MKQNLEQAGAVWDLIQERAANIDSGIGSTTDSVCPNAIYARKLPDGCYELITCNDQESLLIDEKLFAYAKHIANAEGVPIHVSETSF